MAPPASRRDLFTGAADDYHRHRSGLPPEVVSLLAPLLGTPGARRLLDLGTGTGLVVDALLPHLDEAIGVDPEPEMVAVARREVADPRVRWAVAAAEDFRPDDGWAAELVTVCRAFHWMDPDAVLARLAEHASSTATVAVMGDASVWTSTQPWKQEVRALIQSFLGERRRAGSGVGPADGRRHEDVLAASPFGRVEQVTVPVVHERSIDSVAGYLRSTSFAAPRLFGERLPAFDAALRTLLAEHAVDGVVRDENVFGVLLARR
ncbi:class I SAM-dependent methyltransferase [Nocardioides bruguierae]|uniref:Class I SAM-dependent methyltransferase n=1 Tax=Nocardioides bruguierae TaxID=2945102 RepID=A0A9X2IE98_9ACTN|nr:class I SAM-dependent methyltransferase [Nocardioides bruguierae]MCM0619134.1 class I SAM-dependent methyltransferase [Nocardioides bruguierae]